MRRALAMAALAGAAVAGSVALYAGSRRRPRRRVALSRPLQAAEGLLRDEPLIPRAPAQVKGKRRSVCSTDSKLRVKTCMDMPAGPGPVVRHADDACSLLRKEMGADRADRESFYAILLDVRQQVLGVEEVARGHVTGVQVMPREAFKSAVLAGASAVVFAHNHPSGDATPSDADVELTRVLARTGALLGIPAVDHVVVGRTWPGSRTPSCTSLAELRPALFRVEPT